MGLRLNTTQDAPTLSILPTGVQSPSTQQQGQAPFPPQRLSWAALPACTRAQAPGLLVGLWGVWDRLAGSPAPSTPGWRTLTDTAPAILLELERGPALAAVLGHGELHAVVLAAPIAHSTGGHGWGCREEPTQPRSRVTCPPPPQEWGGFKRGTLPVWYPQAPGVQAHSPAVEPPTPAHPTTGRRGAAKQTASWWKPGTTQNPADSRRVPGSEAEQAGRLPGGGGRSARGGRGPDVPLFWSSGQAWGFHGQPLWPTGLVPSTSCPPRLGQPKPHLTQSPRLPATMQQS